MMYVGEIKSLMKYIEKLTQDLGDKLEPEEYYVEDMGCPHKPHRLPKGYAAIYMFIYTCKDENWEYLKIGKANEKSGARFFSQHYGFSAPSTLAKSLCHDEEFIALGVSQDNVKEWMMKNLHRINIYIKAERGKAMTELVESVMHYRFRPRFEGNI